MKLWSGVLFALLIVGVGEAKAQYRRNRAQNRPPVYRPAPVSPYINLLRNDNKAFIYQGIIRPQLESNRFQQMQQQEIETINTEFRSQQALDAARYRKQQEELNSLENFQLKSRETGHPTAFRRRSTYFPSYGNNQ